jgi:delta 1-pyrroline-5-carboxylate dehydrogenase
MNAHEPMRRPESGRRTSTRLAGALLAGVVVAACAGENTFTFAASATDLLGPEVDITAPIPPVTIAPGDSVQVTATLTSSEGITEVSWTGTLDAGGAAPFTPIVVPLTAVLDTTMSRFVVRSGATGGAAKIIVTARDISGDTGADTISVTLGS